MVKEITDYNIINEFINQPSVRPYVAMESKGVLDVRKLGFDDPTFLGYINNNELLGLLVLEHYPNQVHEAHIFFNRQGRRDAKSAGKLMIDWIDSKYPHQFVFGKTPSKNTLAKKYAELWGFQYVKQTDSKYIPGVKFDWCFRWR